MEIEAGLEEISLETLQRWYHNAGTELKLSFGIELPPFPTELREAKTGYNPILGIEHAIGEIFYPCCGNDTETVTRLFGDISERIIFSDPFCGCSLPRCSPRREIDHIVKLEVNNNEPEPHCSGNSIRYFQDGLATFCRHIDNLAVFFYRGDSAGEGGSDQQWLAETLFLAVVAKLPHKGLIVTDGSNSGYLNEQLYDEYVPWNQLAGRNPFDPPAIGKSFTWNHIRITCVAGPFSGSHGDRKTYVWQAENVK